MEAAVTNQNSRRHCINDICLALTYHKVDSITVPCSSRGHWAMDNTCFCHGCKPVKRANNVHDDDDD
uniref:Uncharacterized protein n=1 Tax=Romanomermis culicivorax TaxID=13658 RepID=A0A915JIW7_ROMCU